MATSGTPVDVGAVAESVPPCARSPVSPSSALSALAPSLPEPPRLAAASADWFSELFGFAESSCEDVKSLLRAEPCEGYAGLPSVRIVSEANGASFVSGHFETPSLAELRERVAAARPPPGRLRVRNELGDVAAKHASRENRLATFQVASQFNCLEMPGPSGVPEDGVTVYVRDKTQGPCCAIACGPATVYRNYFVPVGDQVGQTTKCQLDTLAGLGLVLGNDPVGRMFEVRNGFSRVRGEPELAHITRQLAQAEKSDAMDSLRAALRVGVQSDTAVTSSHWGKRQIRNPAQVVTQVFGSALAVAYNKGTRRQSWAPFARLVLEASYEAALCAGALTAVRHGGVLGSKRVFLTQLGGGAFGNDIEWIADAMRRALERFRSCDLDVRIVTYGGGVDPLFQQLELDFDFGNDEVGV